jgi:hypothetical protein
MREKHTEIVKNAAVVLYLEGCGFRRIARILSEIFGKKIHNPMDELYTYTKKRE